MTSLGRKQAPRLPSVSITPPWFADASCRELPAELFDLFYPVKGGSYTDARRICRGCPVRVQCLDLAMTAEEGIGERFGMFGGLSANERDHLAARKSA